MAYSVWTVEATVQPRHRSQVSKQHLLSHTTSPTVSKQHRGLLVVRCRNNTCPPSTHPGCRNNTQAASSNRQPSKQRLALQSWLSEQQPGLPACCTLAWVKGRWSVPYAIANFLRRWLQTGRPVPGLHWARSSLAYSNRRPMASSMLARLCGSLAALPQSRLFGTDGPRVRPYRGVDGPLVHLLTVIVARLLHGGSRWLPGTNPNRICRCIDEDPRYSYGRFDCLQSSLASRVGDPLRNLCQIASVDHLCRAAAPPGLPNTEVQHATVPATELARPLPRGRRPYLGRLRSHSVFTSGLGAASLGVPPSSSSPQP